MKTFREQIAADNTAAFINFWNLPRNIILTEFYVTQSYRMFLLQKVYQQEMELIKLMQGSMVVGCR